jgi:hypothetical protein
LARARGWRYRRGVRVDFAYGRGGLAVELPEAARLDELEKRPGLPSPIDRAFVEADLPIVTWLVEPRVAALPQGPCALLRCPARSGRSVGVTDGG